MGKLLSFLIFIAYLSLINGFDIVIQNRLLSNLEYPQAWVPEGGLQFAPKLVEANQTGYFVFTVEGTDVHTGVIALPIQGSAKKISLAWSLDPAFPKNNKLGLKYGEQTADQTLLDDILDEVVLAKKGWQSQNLDTTAGIKANFFMSSTDNDAGIIVELIETTELRLGEYYIQPMLPEYGGMYLKLGSQLSFSVANTYEVTLEYFENSLDTRYQWSITKDGDYYRIASVAESEYFWSGIIYTKNFMDARKISSSYPSTRWDWDIDQVHPQVFMFWNRHYDQELNLSQCRKINDEGSSPVLEQCKNKSPLAIAKGTVDNQQYVKFKLIPV